MEKQKQPEPESGGGAFGKNGLSQTLVLRVSMVLESCLVVHL